MLNLSKATVDNNYTKSQLQQQNITRNLNSPQAYHFSGIWERLIQSAKPTLLLILACQLLETKVFQTILISTPGISHMSTQTETAKKH